MLSGDVVGGTEQVWLGTVLEDRQDASGLLYRRNRYYSPEQGRFIQEDPIGLAGGLNLYGFAEGDPVNFSDPFGLFAMGCPPCDGEGGFTPTPGNPAPGVFTAPEPGLESPLFSPVDLLPIGALGGFAAKITRGAGKVAAAIDGGKLGYLFGKASGRQHNIARAAQNALQMKRLGATPGEIAEHLTGVVQDASNIAQTYTNKWGTYEVRESLFAGRSGQFAKLQSTWEVMADGTRRLTTVIPFGGR